MSRSVYITSVEGNTGKSTVALGMLAALSRSAGRVGVFRPIARSSTEPDYILDLLLQQIPLQLDASECIGVTYEDVHADPDGALDTIVARFRAIESRCDTVVIVGSDYTDVSSPTELGYNARIAANLGAPMLLVLNGRNPDRRPATPATGLTWGARTPDEIRQMAELTLTELHHEHATLLGVIVNRAEPEAMPAIVASISAMFPDPKPIVAAIPEDRILVAPTLDRLMESVEGTLYKGDPAFMSRQVLSVVVAGMSMENVLTRLAESAAVIVPGDRTEVLIALLMAQNAETFPTLSGIILNGGFDLPPQIEQLIAGIGTELPLIQTRFGTWETSNRVMHTRGRLAADSQRKLDIAISLFAQYVDVPQLLDRLEITRTDVVTPLMFEYDLIERARADRRHIVLPEGTDDRILRAAGTVLQRGVADLTILGEEADIRDRASKLGLDLDAATILSPTDEGYRQRFAEEYARLRAHKGVTLEMARDTVTDVSYFGTMMVHLGLADGMVSGAAHTTAHTIRPAFEIIKTVPGVSVVSSVFLMCLEDRVLVYGDCAVNPNPTAEQLADIAISSAETAAQFSIEPRIAMLSYSTGESGAGEDVEKVRTATELVRARRPDLPIEGPIQYDAAADATVAKAKLPSSQIAGHATVFIFPDLNTGNNTYKAVQRSAGAVAIGPVLQGLRKPVNDLSRGALVKDIVNTVAITAIQAQGTGVPAAADREGIRA
ncbi:MAG: phosphate acetyltransferase [Thermomicrobiales bacterium]